MASFHLLSTRRNPDGSFDTPAIDEVIIARDVFNAVAKARQFPIARFDGGSDIVWLVDQAGTVLWSSDVALSDAA